MATRAKPGESNNLAELENLTEESLLKELKVRFNRDVIYTYVGEILVTVNPYKWIDGIYSDAQARKFTRVGDKASLEPHLFAVADTSFQNMIGSGKDQVAVISGESGAGKTEAAKLFVKHLIHVSNGTEFEGLHRKLVEVNPLLEAFGNAQTLMNDNSSRFGKFTEVLFNEEGAIRGAIMKEYLLEKSRVVYQAEGEQNFHVFYLFFAGLNGENATKYELSDANDHRCLNGNEAAVRAIKSKHIQDMYKELMECITIVGFTDEQTDDLFALLSGVIHLLDIDFDGEDAANIVSPRNVLSSVCNQLGIDETALEMALTKSINVIRGEETERAYKLHEAEDCRDAAAKAVYERAFSWIFTQCNRLLGPPGGRGSGNSIGILDIFGFECFDTNSFEQLCINLANEQLQYFFNDHIFRMELAEYEKEGIDGTKITYDDNKPLLDLLLENRGLFSILDDQSNFPRATDSTFVQKCHESFTSHRDYERPRGNEDKFSLRHYAGKVQYDAFGFLEKNRDNLAVDVVGCFQLSENGLIKHLFGAQGGGARKARGARQRMDRGTSKARMRQSVRHAQKQLAQVKRLSVGNRFKESLGQLMEKLNAAFPHFVRCVKPNTHKRAGEFDDDLVTKQLRYTGMLETTRIRKEGYSYRPLFADFVKRYNVLAWRVANVAPNAGGCRAILDHAGIDGYQVGHTKVFLRYFHVDRLNELVVPVVNCAINLQKIAKGFIYRRRHAKLVEEKERQVKAVDNFISQLERQNAGCRDVMLALCEEDGRRPKDFWTAAAAPPLPAKAPEKKKKGGVGRAASVRWFKEVEKKKGAGMKDGNNKFADWFHGVITRQQAQDLLSGKTSGTFLIRVAESRFGYSLSLIHQGRIKHFMIDLDDAGQYIVVGNDRTFPSLNDIVEHHNRFPVTSAGDLLLHPCQGLGARDDLAELS